MLVSGSSPSSKVGGPNSENVSCQSDSLNVAAFGAAFVDIGVHQDGSVHISAMAKTYMEVARSIRKASRRNGARSWRRLANSLRRAGRSP
jgi:hypothetical protein